MNDSRPNLGTFLVLIAIFSAFFAAQHLDMKDSEADQSHAARAALDDAQKQRRKDVAAQYACGPQAAYEWISESTVQCFTKRGSKAGTTEVAAK